MSAIERFVENNEKYAEEFSHGGLPVAPGKKLAIIACMDSRMSLFHLLGLDAGDAHVIRNAGGVVTDDVIRSLMLSQRLLGTREVMLIHHTDCGLQKVDEERLHEEVRCETGVELPFALEAFSDPDASVRRSIARLRESPFIEHTDVVRGFVYDVETGRLREVAG